MTFQELLLRLEQFWAQHGCLILQPYDVEVGAGTMAPGTALRSLGPEPWNVAYVQPSRRPADGRYGRNPMRVQHYYQYQVILKPSPENVVDLYLDSLRALDIDPLEHDIRFVEDDWEAPTLGASGVGWEVWLDGTEITQFTYFQQMGGIECRPVCAEITYGPERLAMCLQKKESFWELEWAHGITYGEVDRHAEIEHNYYNFDHADVQMLFRLFEMFEAEGHRIVNLGYTHPAFDYALKCSHVFNLLDARGSISVTERASYINRVRALARKCCVQYLKQREEMGFPLLKAQEALTVA
ncbi:MAG: glycine--tRNA ligase alpha subunit [Armatimonadota bacterium]|nr:MAG: glycine--tRNA ligase alpha subunit [Armatimonadota bacterium]